MAVRRRPPLSLPPRCPERTLVRGLVYRGKSPVISALTVEISFSALGPPKTLRSAQREEMRTYLVEKGSVLTSRAWW